MILVNSVEVKALKSAVLLASCIAVCLAKKGFVVDVFIKCPKCGDHNCIDGVAPLRVDLAVLRGSEDPIKCKECQADMDTMTAYLGERVGSDIVRREDPKWGEDPKY